MGQILYKTIQRILREKERKKEKRNTFTFPFDSLEGSMKIVRFITLRDKDL